jgi:hypothetical protein
MPVVATAAGAQGSGCSRPRPGRHVGDQVLLRIIEGAARRRGGRPRQATPSLGLEGEWDTGEVGTGDAPIFIAQSIISVLSES